MPGSMICTEPTLHLFVILFPVQYIGKRFALETRENLFDKRNASFFVLSLNAKRKLLKHNNYAFNKSIFIICNHIVSGVNRSHEKRSWMCRTRHRLLANAGGVLE